MYELKIEPNKVLETKFGRARIDSRGYYRITTSKEGNFNKSLHRLIFKEFYRKIPDGCVVHHKDNNELNNCIVNLQLLTEKEHNKLHAKGRKNSRFNDCIKIYKFKDKRGCYYQARPYNHERRFSMSSVNLDKVIEQVEEFINSPLNTYGYTDYEVI